MNVGSLFSGIGGLELGLERAGMKTLWQVEKDDFARSVLAKHWPNVARFDDVCAVGARNLPAVDLICGGFPCQDISVAGKGGGIREGTRSGLWLEYARIVRELRPRFVLVENVPALRSRGLDRVLGDLVACGYDCEWDGIPARAVGALHQRDRIFLIAYSKREFLREQSGWGSGENRAGAPLAAEHGSSRSLADPYGERELQQGGPERAKRGRVGNGSRAPGDLADPNGARLEEREGIFSHAREELAAFERGCRTGAGVWRVEPDVGRVANGIPRRMDRLRCLGNAVVPQVAEFIGRRLMQLVGGAA